MITFGRRRCAYCLSVALALLAGCVGSQPPIAVPGAILQGSAIATHADPSKSWMLPEAKTIKRLLYISDDGNSSAGQVLVYDYNSGDLVGTLSGFQRPWGQCVDSKGDVWIADLDADTVSEYAHGGITAIGSVRAISPGGCAISTNGDLAVTAQSRSGPDELEIWKNARGEPSIYSNNTCYELLTPAYDDRGNVLVEGGFAYSSSDERWDPCELLARSSQLAVATLDHSLGDGGGAVWDGRNIVLTLTRSRGSTELLRIAIGRSGALRVVGKTKLAGDDPACKNFPSVVGLPFVVGDKNTPVNRTRGSAIVGADICPESRFGYWHYPSGGAPFRALGSQPMQPSGSAVSIAD